MLWRCRRPTICWCLGLRVSSRPHGSTKGEMTEVATLDCMLLAVAQFALLVPRAQQPPSRQP